jgi:hypothetical protein
MVIRIPRILVSSKFSLESNFDFIHIYICTNKISKTIPCSLLASDTQITGYISGYLLRNLCSMLLACMLGSQISHLYITVKLTLGLHIIPNSVSKKIRKGGKAYCTGVFTFCDRVLCHFAYLSGYNIYCRNVSAAADVHVL